MDLAIRNRSCWRSFLQQFQSVALERIMILVLKPHGNEMGDFFGRVVLGENESVAYTEVAHGHEQEILQNCLKFYRPK